MAVRWRLILPPAPPSGPLPETDAEIARIVDALRQAVRLGGLAYSTEETYVYWIVRFTRFCLARLKQTPQDAGTPALSIPSESNTSRIPSASPSSWSTKVPGCQSGKSRPRLATGQSKAISRLRGTRPTGPTSPAT